MPHNRFFLKEQMKVGDLCYLEGDELHHMHKVMRQRQGDLVELVNGRGTLATAQIEMIGKKNAELRITESKQENEYNKGFCMAIAILKPASLELVCEKVTELGASEIKIFPADKSEKSHLSNHLLSRIHRHIISALKQSGRLYLPTLHILDTLEAVLEEECIYCDLDGEAKKIGAVAKDKDYVTAIIGPESGFSKEERALLKAKATPALLHPNTLKAETAAITAASLISDTLY